MIRIGFVGVGKWARQLRSAFNWDPEARFPRHMRKLLIEGEGFGHLWEDEETFFDGLDLVIAAADPVMTTRIAIACAERCLPCVATKPLLSHPMITGAPFYVDFWRLWSLPYLEFKERVTKGPWRCAVNFQGDGPYRETMGGLDDYYPHVSAFLHDLWGRYYVGSSIRFPTDRGEGFSLLSGMESLPVSILVGNGFDHSQRKIEVANGTGIHALEEFSDGTITYTHGGGKITSTKTDALRRFARHVLRVVREEIPRDDRTLMYSILSRGEIAKIRELAEAHK